MVPEKDSVTIYFKKGSVDPESIASLLNWLRSEVGCENWNYWTSGSSYQLNFKHEEDKVKFILRWL